MTCPRSLTCEAEEPGPDTGACVLTQLCRDEAAGLPGRGLPDRLGLQRTFWRMWLLRGFQQVNG